jgi:hypothetical protein
MAKPIVTKHVGETIVQRPNRVRCRYELKNGQLLSVYFTRKRVKQPEWDICFVWTVAVHIGHNRREANRWYRGMFQEHASKQTGDCGLEGLIIALRYIQAFCEKLCGARSELQINWSDDKRMRAYRYLLRYPGFVLYEEKGKNQCLAYRNPELFKWVGSDG